MKTIFALAFCLTVVGVYATEKYTTKFDNINIDQILSNDRLFNTYANCLLKDKHCTPDANELKALLPDALKTNCEKCSEKQKAGAQKVISFLAKKKPEIWEQVLTKYDKENIYRTRYADEAKKLGVPV